MPRRNGNIYKYVAVVLLQGLNFEKNLKKYVQKTVKSISVNILPVTDIATKTYTEIVLI